MRGLQRAMAHAARGSFATPQRYRYNDLMIVIAGGTGFLGRALATTFVVDGQQVTVLTRKRSSATASSASIARVEWHPDGEAGQAGAWMNTIEGAEAVVNLAGESIASGRWTARRKAQLVESRLHATRGLAGAIAAAANPPAVFVSASAIGYYGDRGDEVLSEASAPGSDFLANLCVQWEREAMRAKSPRTRVAVIRTGIVLDPTGGALAKMLPPFKMFVGGPLGSGRQYMSWIHLTDWVRLVRWVVGSDPARGPINAAAPEPVTNREFAKALGAALHRPSLLPAPAFALRALLGEMAGPLLLASQRVIPARALELQFEFSSPRLQPALHALFANT